MPPKKKTGGVGSSKRPPPPHNPSPTPSKRPAVALSPQGTPEQKSYEQIILDQITQLPDNIPVVDSQLSLETTNQGKKSCMYTGNICNVLPSSSPPYISKVVDKTEANKIVMTSAAIRKIENIEVTTATGSITTRWEDYFVIPDEKYCQLSVNLCGKVNNSPAYAFSIPQKEPGVEYIEKYLRNNNTSKVKNNLLYDKAISDIQFALGILHRHGLLHGDIKDNIYNFVYDSSDDKFKLIDFSEMKNYNIETDAETATEEINGFTDKMKEHFATMLATVTSRRAAAAVRTLNFNIP